ncbi:hypothetical protein HK096_007535, partial [Nowakowskiella sp. JEL0078]
MGRFKGIGGSNLCHSPYDGKSDCPGSKNVNLCWQQEGGTDKFWKRMVEVTMAVMVEFAVKWIQ